jgi:hypothetical protein
VAVQWCAETFLVEVMPDEADTAPEHEQPVQRADLDVLLGFFGCKRTAVTQEVDEADCDTSIDVEDKL